MFIIYEVAACILVALVATTVPFTVFAICLLLKSGAEYLSGTLRKLTQCAHSAVINDFSRRIVGQSVVQAQFPLVETAVGRNDGNIRRMLRRES